MMPASTGRQKACAPVSSVVRRPCATEVTEEHGDDCKSRVLGENILRSLILSRRSCHDNRVTTIVLRREWFDALNVDLVGVHVELAGDLYLFAYELPGFVLVIELVADVGRAVLEDELALLLHDRAAERLGVLSLRVALRLSLLLSSNRLRIGFGLLCTGR